MRYLIQNSNYAFDLTRFISSLGLNIFDHIFFQINQMLSNVMFRIKNASSSKSGSKFRLEKISEYSFRVTLWKIIVT